MALCYNLKNKKVVKTTYVIVRFVGRSRVRSSGIGSGVSRGRVGLGVGGVGAVGSDDGNESGDNQELYKTISLIKRTLLDFMATLTFMLI